MPSLFDDGDYEDRGEGEATFPWMKILLAVMGVVVVAASAFFLVPRFVGDDDGGSPSASSSESAPGDDDPETGADGGEVELHFPDYAPGVDRSPPAPSRMTFPYGGGQKEIDINPVQTVTTNHPVTGEMIESLVPSSEDIDTAASWYEYSAWPGSGDQGTVVFVAHADFKDTVGVGKMWQEDLMNVGAEATVLTHGGDEMRYRTIVAHDVEKLDEQAFQKLSDVTFNRAQGPEALILVTCGGVFDPDSVTGYPLNHIIVMEPVR